MKCQLYLCQGLPTWKAYFDFQYLVNRGLGKGRLPDEKTRAGGWLESYGSGDVSGEKQSALIRSTIEHEVKLE